MDILWKPVPNFSVGRKKLDGQPEQALAIVDHITGALMPSPLNTFLNPANQVSAHYIICRDGTITQCVKDGDTAWHGGIVNTPHWDLYAQMGFNPNRWTIGIEHEGFDGTLTEPQYQASLWLHKQLIAKFGIPIDDNHIVGHYRIDSVNRPNCPGPNFPWARLFTDLKGGEEDMKLAIEVAGVNTTLNGAPVANAVLLTVDGVDTAYIPDKVLRDAGLQVNWDAATSTVSIITK